VVSALIRHLFRCDGKVDSDRAEQLRLNGGLYPSALDIARLLGQFLRDLPQHTDDVV